MDPRVSLDVRPNGAGLPTPAYLLTLTLTDEPPFAFFGGAGELDFNYEEVLELDWALDSRGLAHFVEFYSGPHAWPPSEVFERALEWMDVQAVQAELRGRDQGLLDVLYEKRLGRAQRLEADGAVHSAVLRYHAVVADFDGLVDVTVPRRRAEEPVGIPRVPRRGYSASGGGRGTPTIRHRV